MYTSGPVWQLASVSHPCRIRPATVRRVPPYFSCRAMSLNLSAQSVVVAANEQLSSNMGGETVILNLADSTYYGLDPVGTRVWDLVQEPKTVREVVDTLLQEYEVDIVDSRASSA